MDSYESSDTFGGRWAPREQILVHVNSRRLHNLVPARGFGLDAFGEFNRRIADWHKAERVHRCIACSLRENMTQSGAFNEPGNVFDKQQKVHGIERGRIEIKVFIESARRFILRVNENRANTNDVCGGQHAPKRIQ